MGAIGGMLGLSGGAGGTSFGGPAQSNQQGMNNLQASYAQLQNVANGQGPNPAQAQYTANVQNLAKQQAGAINSVQGISPALAARMATQQGSGAMQNAAAQGQANMATQQLGAMGAAGSIAANQANAANQMQSNINNTNAGLAQTTMQGQQGIVGGIGNGLGSIMGLAKGGRVPSMAEGGPVGPQSSFAQYLSGIQAPQMGVEATSAAPVNHAWDNSKTQKVKVQPSAPVQNAGQGPTVANAGQLNSTIPYAQPTYMPASPMAKGGKVPAMLSPGEAYIPPEKVGKAAKSANPIAQGKVVPGKPRVAGNSYANDVVPAKLKEGGVVIPNSIMQSKDPAAGARDFIADLIAKRRGRK